MGKKYKQQKTYAAPASFGTAYPIIGTIFLFTIMGLSTSKSAKAIALVCIVLAALCGIRAFSRLCERVHLPVVMLGLVTLSGGLSTAYAASGKFALYEFLKIITAFTLALVFLSTADGEASVPGRRIAGSLAGAAALTGLVSIDLLSTRVLSGIVTAFWNFITPDYQNLAGVEPGIRMVSVFDNPNVFAGCVGIGVLLSLSLVLSSEEKKERTAYTVCLFINSLSFVLAFSMGASATIALAFLAYLALECSRRRAALFILMLETLIVTMAATVPIAATAFDPWDGVQPIPLLCVVAGAALLCLMDKMVGRRVAEKMETRGKLLLAVIALSLAALIGAGLLALNLTGSAELSAGEQLRRAAYPEAGEYVLCAEVSGPVSVRIESQNRQDTMMHTSTVLYNGDLSQAAFTVPEDSMVVYFNFSAKEALTMESVRYEGSSVSGSIPLGYKLLPGFISNRMQGLFANQNAIQRLVFFEDGMKLFRRSPLLGLGLGTFANGVGSVQSFFYETKYAHNHYIQLLAETGAVGLVLFVLLLAASAAAVLLKRKQDGEEMHPLIPALGAALVFMAGHAGVEVTFSFHAYLPLAFGVFALINLCCGDALHIPALNPGVRSGYLLGTAAAIAVFAALLCSNMAAHWMISSGDASFDTAAKAISMDKFEWSDYALTYIRSAADNPQYDLVAAQADQYALKLSELDSNIVPLRVADYYFKTERPEQAFAMLEKYVTYVASQSESWQSAFNMMEKYCQDTDSFRAGVLRIADLMDTWNAENIGTVSLNEQAQLFLNELRTK